MFTQPWDHKIKTKPAYKKHCSFCHLTNHFISKCFRKHRDDGNKLEPFARSKFPQKAYVQYLRSISNGKLERNDDRFNENSKCHRSRSTSRNNQ